MKNKEYYELLDEELYAAEYAIHRIADRLARYEETAGIILELSEADDIVRSCCTQIDEYIES